MRLKLFRNRLTLNDQAPQLTHFKHLTIRSSEKDCFILIKFLEKKFFYNKFV